MDDIQNTDINPEGQVDAAGEDVVLPGDAPAKDNTPAPEFDWRAEGSKGDEKILGRLGRYKSLGDFVNAGIEAQNALRERDTKLLPKDATEEQLAEWRVNNGIPETPDKYELSLDDGLVIGEDDKPMVDSVLAEMHKVNATPEMVSAAINAYYRSTEQQAAMISEKDQSDAASALEVLRGEWGEADRKQNYAAIKSLLNQIPEEARDKLANARLGDGTAMFNSPEMLAWFADVSRKLNPAVTLGSK